MKVYLIRHGETEYNLAHRIQGWCDVDLTETGVSQAKALKERIGNFKFDRIIVSDLYRTRHTASIVFGYDPKIEFDSRVREVNNTVISGQYVQALTELYGEHFDYARKHLDYSYFGGESEAHFCGRNADFLKSLENDKNSERIAVVTHGGAICAMCSVVENRPNISLPIKNCSVTVLDFDGEKWSVESLNNTTSEIFMEAAK
jgi:broad specificity phosphatase PhoE